MTSVIWSMNLRVENCAAWSVSVFGSHSVRDRRSTASAINGGRGSSKKTPVVPSTVVSKKPPQRSAAVGLPNDAASTGVRPKSS